MAIRFRFRVTNSYIHGNQYNINTMVIVKTKTPTHVQKIVDFVNKEEKEAKISLEDEKRLLMNI